MRKLTQSVLFVMLGLLCSVGTAVMAIPKDKAVEIHHGFYKANHYRELPDFVRRAYIAGVFDALMLSPLFGAPKAEVTWLERCAEGMQDDQLQAIVDRFVEAHPERWDQDMGTVAYGALTQACTARGFPPKID
jgi:hypothetical protein